MHPESPERADKRLVSQQTGAGGVTGLVPQRVRMSQQVEG